MTHISYSKFAKANDHNEFLNRISKTLYYKKFPRRDGLSLPITELAAEIFTDVKIGKSLDRLDIDEASRISRHACVSPCSFVLALLYIERLKDCNPEYLQKVAPSELFLVTLMVASKYLMDDGEEDEVFNSEWAQSGQISTCKMNNLEMEFLKAINWAIFVYDKEFWERLHKLERDIAFKEAKKRGWFSYTDLHSLLNLKQLEMLLNTIVSVSSVCIVTYAAGLVTLLGSVLLASQMSGSLISKNQQSLIVYPLKVEVSDIQNNSEVLLQDDIVNTIIDASPISNIYCNKSTLYSDETKQQYSHGFKWNWIQSLSEILYSKKWKNNHSSVFIQNKDFKRPYFKYFNEHFSSADLMKTNNSSPKWQEYIEYHPKVYVNQRR